MKCNAKQQISLIGRSLRIHHSQLSSVIESLRVCAALEVAGANDCSDYLQTKEWIVDSPLSMSAYDSDHDSPCLNSLEGQCCSPFTRGLDYLPRMNGIVTQGLVVDGNYTLERQNFGLRLLLRRYMKDKNESYLIKISSIKYQLDSFRTINLLDGLVELFGIHDSIAITFLNGVTYFRIKEKLPGGGCVENKAFSQLSEGMAVPSMTLSGLDQNLASRYLDLLRERHLGEESWFHDYDVRVRPVSCWPAITSYMCQFYSGPWVQSHLGKPLPTAGLMSVLHQGPEHDVTPLGVLGGKRKRKGLGPRGVYVDLFKEGDGWYVAFHYIEHQAGPKQRAATIETIHNLLGMKLIERTPETLWPHIFH